MNRCRSPELAELLAREHEMRGDRDGWIFPSPHKDSTTGHRRHMQRPFREAVKAAGLDAKLVTPHVMRHTAITRLVKAKVDLLTIKRISGHKTTAMVEHYTHIHGEHIDTAIAAIDTAVPDTITPELHTAADPEPAAGEVVQLKSA